MRFLQIHTLTAYPAALLNRDDAGFAKRLPFGGTIRTRVSSQCLKRHWRRHEGEHALAGIPGESLSIRSRETFERFVRRPLVQEDGVPDAVAAAVTQSIADLVLGKSAAKTKQDEGDAKKKGRGKKAEVRSGAASAPPVMTAQVTVLGRAEVEFLRGEARAICAEVNEAKDAAKAVKAYFQAEGKKNLKALAKAAMGLDASLFGRMVTSDMLATGDAAVHVAHAFTVHEEESETDYFTAVDDLRGQGDEAALGSGHINTTELTSGLYYGYVVVDLPLLVSNLTGCARSEWQQADRSLAGEVVSRLLHLVATVSPGAKLGSTAPYARAHLVLAELGKAQPRTLANAFLRAVSPRPDLLHNAYVSLAAHLAEQDEMYGKDGVRCAAAMGPREALDGVLDRDRVRSLSDVVTWAAERITARSA